jgi:hypothetical protein
MEKINSNVNRRLKRRGMCSESLQIYKIKENGAC